MSIESTEQAHQGTHAILSGLLAWWLASVALRVCSRPLVALHVWLVTKVSEFLLSQRWPFFNLVLLIVLFTYGILKIKLLVTYLSYSLTAVFPLSSPLIPSSHLPYNTPAPHPQYTLPLFLFRQGRPPMGCCSQHVEFALHRALE